MSKSYCPLSVFKSSELANADSEFFECKQNECRWWNVNECSVKDIALFLEEISISLNLLTQKLLEIKQFLEE